MSLAKIVVSGTVETDPEKRYTPNNHAVTNFNIAVLPPAFGKQASEPFSVKVTCWRALADAIVEQVNKGDEVLIDGRLLMNSFQTPEGVQKKSFEIEANTVEKLGAPTQTIVAECGGNSDGKSAPAPQKQQQPVGVSASAPSAASSSSEGMSADELLTDDDIPF